MFLMYDLIYNTQDMWWFVKIDSHASLLLYLMFAANELFLEFSLLIVAPIATYLGRDKTK